MASGLIGAEFIGRVEFSSAVQRLRKGAQNGLVDPKFGTLQYQAGRLAEHCMKLTPPKNLEQGMRRVKFDVEKIFHPIDPEDLRSVGLRKLVTRSDFSGWERFSNTPNAGEFKGTKAITPTGELHAENRDGRGRAKKTRYVTLFRQRQELNSVIRNSQKNVGMAKSGWCAAIAQFGSDRPIPEWVQRHGIGRGTASTSAHGDRPFVEFSNTTRWAKNHEEAERIAANALRARTSAMEKYFNKMMELAAQKAEGK